MLNHFRFAYFGIFAFVLVVQAQDQSGFISLDCGISEDSSYIDPTTGIKYISDASFIDTGLSKSVSYVYRTNAFEQQLWNVRSFPDGTKNCYTLKPAQARGNKYLIRTSFLYANYDQNGTAPGFDLYIGANKWDTVKLTSESMVNTYEIIHIPSTNFIFVCLVNTGYGIPFISSLELRPLENSTYRTPYASLVLFRRWDLGSTTNQTIRYKDDVHDRMWWPFSSVNTKILSTSLTIDANAHSAFYLPSAVMETAVTPDNSSNSLELSWQPDNPTSKYYVYMHFAEVEKLQANDTREFNISQNGVYWVGPVDLSYLYTTTVYSRQPVSGDKIEYSIFRTGRSTKPPVLNGLEIYTALETTQSQTDEQDVNAMMNIKSKYGVKRNWEGDPCAPKDYLWEGLNCSYGDDPLRIISLDLSSSGLIGAIDVSLSSLTMIKSLNLSNNRLTGQVPNFLSQLQFLSVLDLGGNNLTGPVPADLIEKRNSGSLILSLDKNLEVCSPASCKKKKHKYVIPLVVSAAAALVLLLALAVLRGIRRRKKVAYYVCSSLLSDEKARKTKSLKMGSLEPKHLQFSYSEILAITNNFEKVIGEGGFGIVYYGYLDETQVAVKMLSPTSAQGIKEFQAEIKLLLRIHHRNLTPLIGYCNEGTNKGLIYEYMANGNLARVLSDKSSYVLSWEERLRIAMDAAQGLEYLHNGCKPPIIHRDVKPSNILLNEKFQAKLSDFGLSRIFPAEGGSHISTVVAGTPGYLDPEYYTSNWLNEKSDVYSFGVVLLEIITSRHVLMKTEDQSHIVQWVSSMLRRGQIKDIVDPRLQGDFNTNSAWKVVEIAMACVSAISARRPTMINIVMELKECLALELARTREDDGTESKEYSCDMMTLSVDAEFTPFAR
ncbi:hypothetical protein UlMin_014081 [Ulmus minor]